jgi:hypothetical protein
LPEIIGLRLSSPSPDRQCHGACPFCSKLEATRANHWQAYELADNGTQSAKGQPLFHVGKHVFFTVGFHKDHPVRMKAHLRESWKKQIWPRQAPDDRSFGSRRNAGCKKRSRCTINRPCPAACKFVQCAVGKATARQNPVNVGDAKRQGSGVARRVSFQRSDTLAQI